MRMLALPLTAVLLAGCGGSEPDSESGGDGPATLACQHFRNVVADAPTLTDAEVRDKLREVRDTARRSETPGIAANAQQMLIQVTSGTATGFGEAVSEFSAVCSSVGL